MLGGTARSSSQHNGCYCDGPESVHWLERHVSHSHVLSIELQFKLDGHHGNEGGCSIRGLSQLIVGVAMRRHLKWLGCFVPELTDSAVGAEPGRFMAPAFPYLIAITTLITVCNWILLLCASLALSYAEETSSTN